MLQDLESAKSVLLRGYLAGCANGNAVHRLKNVTKNNLCLLKI